ncbi:MAG: META domain-containing protein [Sphingobacterium sp.]
MKTTASLMLLLSMTFFTSCSIFKKSSSSQTSQETMGNSSITGVKWKLIELDGKPVADKINGKEPFIKLSDDRYSGTGGCNGVGGTFTLKDNGRIAFSQGMSTMMACEIMEIEHGLNKALVAADNYTINGDTLSLNKARMAPLARFVEITDTADGHALNGTWEVDDISGSEIALDKLYPNGKPTLVFDLPSTKASGNGSCNNYSLTFTLEGGKIKFGGPMSTEMACEGNGEVAFFKTLKTVTQYSVHGETLNLIMGDVAVMRLAKK